MLRLGRGLCRRWKDVNPLPLAALCWRCFVSGFRGAGVGAGAGSALPPPTTVTTKQPILFQTRSCLRRYHVGRQTSASYTQLYLRPTISSCGVTFSYHWSAKRWLRHTGTFNIPAGQFLHKTSIHALLYGAIKSMTYSIPDPWSVYQSSGCNLRVPFS